MKIFLDKDVSDDARPQSECDEKRSRASCRVMKGSKSMTPRQPGPSCRHHRAAHGAPSVATITAMRRACNSNGAKIRYIMPPIFQPQARVISQAVSFHIAISAGHARCATSLYVMSLIHARMLASSCYGAIASKSAKCVDEDHRDGLQIRRPNSRAGFQNEMTKP